MSRWDGKTKGSLVGYKIFLFFINTLGLDFAYRLLQLVTYYYYLFAKKQKRALLDFYQNILHFPVSEAKKLARQNFYIFGQTLVDRAAFLLGKTEQLNHVFENEQYLVDIRDGGKGGILLSAHLGNWETAGNLLKGRITPTINIVMLDAEVESIKQFMDTSTGGSRFKVIAIKDDLSHIIAIRNALVNNEFIAIHSDRYLDGAKFIELDFFGRKAKFPYGPFVIASKFDAPVTFVFAAKDGKYSYHLSATLPITDKLKPEEIARLYVAELERKVKEYPEQWFNYFNFFV
ncbi:lysophospholipid acyltransferase family protein [Dyadobacter fanqingshengii]|uniref:Lysophospholipid acyltransferase family protein n=1 Tax=Dyadobacter fanqingshengii TaxID=2906443 RepID=A0A9X1PAZ9_9BACT|nr:lysophospholipid acyltransferase family protein [Dyadobacter fanqingshengii]MCF0041651.1 lysophospholipid acyltransferase family protein [Dyadobacter fanqingshengii]USJ36633.1 lysophospholipid acyltransferase family protein [Dyadobacter fanqingshengii]